ncbi:MAG: hypothetical protein M3461_01910 [Pseudomonadota bacterium]|nr:hypothetical protein [Pseudomonadota bacterium]
MRGTMASGPGGLMLAKVLGGGLLPISMFLARHEVMEVCGQPPRRGSARRRGGR